MATNRRQLKHSISMANMDKRQVIKTRLTESLHLRPDEVFHYVDEKMAVYLNYMISFLRLDDRFSKVVMDDFVDLGMLDHLNDAKALHCFRNVRLLYPLRTLGDGNCLLHAASLAMWSFSDHNALLRRLVYVALSNDDKGLFKRRWRHRQERIDKEEGNITHSEQEWAKMWEDITESASDVGPRQLNQLPYKSLEHIHVFALSNILRRPIVIVSDTVVHYPSGSVHESVDTFDGIYLPLLWKPKECIKYPLVLGYANSHFAPLLGMDPKLDDRPPAFHEVIPLVKYNYEQRIVHFLLENEEVRSADLLGEYLVLKELPHTEASGLSEVLCAELKYNPLPDDLNLIWDHFEDLTKAFRKDELPKTPEKEIPPIIAPAPNSEDVRFNLNTTEKSKTVEMKKKNIEELFRHEESYPDEWSLMHEECAFENCKYRSSKTTRPYCHEHYKPKNARTEPAERLLDLNLQESNENETRDLLGERAMEVSETVEKEERGEVCGQCCSSEKCKRKGSCEGRCTHHYVMEPLTEDYPTCRRRGCDFHGTPKNGEYCTECVQFYGLQEDELEILDKLPPRETWELQHARPFFKCEEDGCYAASTECTLGYCNRHFLDRFKAKKIDIPTREAAARYLRKMTDKRRRRSLELSALRDGTERERHPSGEGRGEKRLCATPGCAGLRCKGLDLCLECHRSVRYEREPVPVVLANYHVPRDEEEEMEIEPRRGDPDIIESAEPSRAGSPTGCKAPGCYNKGSQVYSGLCEKCYGILQRANLEKRAALKVEERPLFPDPVRQCKRSGCGYAGTTQQNGYCSRCYAKQLKGDILSEESQKALQSNFMTLLENMQPNGVIDILFSKSALNYAQMEEVQATRTTREKIKYVLEQLLHRGTERNYDAFVQALHSTRQSYLAELLKKPHAVQAHPSVAVKRRKDDYDVRRKHRSNHSKPVASPCVNPSCDRFGDPNLRGFCSVCAERYGVLSASNVPIVGLGSRHRVPSSESRGPGECGPSSVLVTPGSTFDETYARVERVAKESRQKCRYRGCENYGNPRNHGYCNAGHIECDHRNM